MPTAPTAPATDEELVVRAADGDDAAFDELVSRHEGRVFRLARRLVASDADAEEVLQETFLLVYRNLASFRGEAAFTTWLYRVATNTARMHLRKNRRHADHKPLDDLFPAFDERGHVASEADFGRAARADELLERSQLAKIALDGVAALPEMYRTVFVLRDLEELSTNEVAEILEIEPVNVRQRLHRARLMVRAYLAERTGGG